MTSRPSPAATRADLIADTAIELLAERGTRGLTHRAVDEAAALPPGSTSNHARTRAALLTAAVRRLAVRESAVLAPAALDRLADGVPALADVVAEALHRQLTQHRPLVLARYELALEASRRPELRAEYDGIGASTFRAPLVELLRARGSAEPERHALSLVAWCNGVLFTHTAGGSQAVLPSRAELRASARELLCGMLGAERHAADDTAGNAEGTAERTGPAGGAAPRP